MVTVLHHIYYPILTQWSYQGKLCAPVLFDQVK